MNPSLPQFDPDGVARARSLANARADYVFRYDYHDIVAITDVPLREKDDVRYWAAVAKAAADLGVNKLASERPDRKARTQAPNIDYANMYTTIGAPIIVDCWQRDDIFSYQAVAGCNPYILRRSVEPIEHFPVTEAQFRRAIPTGDTLAAARAEGRLYVSDYVALAGAAEGTVDGLRKYNFAPLAMYVWETSTKTLMPVAIQCGQTPGPSQPIFTPADGTSWQMARRCVMAGEGNYQGIISHFALCHQVMESVILSSRRQLAANHPILTLLAPHFQNTVLANSIAMSNLIDIGGHMDRLQSPTLDASLGIATRSIADFRLTESAPRKDFAARGVADLAALGDYPARDDGLLVWDATQPFVEAYLRLYYTTDGDVVGDVELAAWVAELGSQEGGRLNGIARPTTVAAVVDLVAQIIFRCTAYHASINYSSFPLFSFAPNMPTSAFGPGPTGGATDTADALAAMLPPYAEACEAFTLFYEITVRLNQLGQYPSFADARVAPLLSAYQARLGEVEQMIATRNQTRRLVYPYQLPSQVSLSIHV